MKEKEKKRGNGEGGQEGRAWENGGEGEGGRSKAEGRKRDMKRGGEKGG